MDDRGETLQVVDHQSIIIWWGGSRPTVMIKKNCKHSRKHNSHIRRMVENTSKIQLQWHPRSPKQYSWMRDSNAKNAAKNTFECNVEIRQWTFQKSNAMCQDQCISKSQQSHWLQNELIISLIEYNSDVLRMESQPLESSYQKDS